MLELFLAFNTHSPQCIAHYVALQAENLEVIYFIVVPPAICHYFLT